jgi:transposase-like protein
LKQHFLLSAKARTLSVVQIARMGEDEAYAVFKAVRFADSGGEPVCPRCDCNAVYTYRARREFKCKACDKRFTLTSGTIFASRKLSYRDILTAIAMFVNGANGVAALKLGRDLNLSYKTSFNLAHKLRESMGSMRKAEKLTGVVEVDGVWVGGHVRPRNPTEARIDRRKLNPKDFTPEQWKKVEASLAKRKTIVTLRERRRGGRTLSIICDQEKDAVPFILAMTDEDAIIHADEGPAWGTLHFHRTVLQVTHKRRYVDHDKKRRMAVHTNWCESFNSRVRRAERGVHHHISGRYLQRYADEFGWREDVRRQSNGQQFASLLRAATQAPISRDMKGYWQRRTTDCPGPTRPRMRLPG